MNRIDELRATYKRMPDAQLLDLAAELDQLTDDARAALRDELDRRGIAAEASEPRQSEPRSKDATAAAGPAPWNLLGERSSALPDSELVAVFSAASDSEAAEIQQSLRAAGIKSQVEYVILVPHAQSEKAFAVLSEQLGPDADLDEEEEDEEGIDPEEER